MRWFLPFLACLFALILPWKLRNLFTKILGYWMQAMYFMYGRVLQIILGQIERKGKNRE